MYYFIQAVPSIYFISIVISLLIFLFCRIQIRMNPKWWEKHICSDFSKSGHHPACHSCNDTGKSCYNDLNKCEALREIS